MEYIAHRGNDKINAENRLEYILKTLENPLVDGIEVDVHLTKDYQLVLSHNLFLKEKTFDYTCICKSKLRNLQKKQFVFEGNVFKIHTLKELLEKLPANKILIIECKTTLADHKRYAKALEKCVRKYKNKKICICSFDYAFLKDFKKYYPEYSCGLLIGYTLNQNKNYDIFDFLSVHSNLVKIYFQKKPCYVWTVNDKKEIEKLKQTNIKGVISDHINQLRSKM